MYGAAIIGGLVALLAVVGATVAVSLGKITGETYATILGTFGGAGLGVGAHAAGVSQPSPRAPERAGPVA